MATKENTKVNAADYSPLLYSAMSYIFLPVGLRM